MLYVLNLEHSIGSLVTRGSIMIGMRGASLKGSVIHKQRWGDVHQFVIV